MVRKSQIITVNHSKSPTIIESYRLLYNMLERNINFVPRKVDKPLILYGAGNLGKMAKKYFETLNIPISLVTDKYPEQYINDTFWNNTKIISPENVSNQQKQSSLLAVCIVTSSFSKIKHELEHQGWNDIVPFYDISQSYIDIHPLNNGWYTNLTENHITNIRHILSKLEDDISRAHYLQFIEWHTLREEWIFKDAPITNDNRYFIPEILSALTNSEVFVDIGAHHGEVILKFLDIVNHKYNKIYAFEPDRKNYTQLYINLKDSIVKNINKIVLFPKSLHSENTVKQFYYRLDYMSQLSKLGKTAINTTTIDNIKFSTPPTFIKIHTEGSEYEIIKGGLNTIINNRPILAITTYHNEKGLHELPLLLIESLDNYKFYFRLHSWCGTGSVMYAIPNERIKSYE